MGVIGRLASLGSDRQILQGARPNAVRKPIGTGQMVAHTPTIPIPKSVRKNWTLKLWRQYVKTENDVSAARMGYTVDEGLGKHVCEFIETYCHFFKGEWAGKRVKLADWQRNDVIMPLYSWVRPDGTRRFRTADIWVSKKNGKSTLGAWLALYALVGDGEPGAEVYCAAMDKKQAAIIYKVAADIVDKSPKLKAMLKVTRSTNNIANGTSSWLKACSADVGTWEGIDASHRHVDEIHVFDQNGRALLDTLRYSGASRQQPLEIHTSTAGEDPTGVGYAEYEKSKGVLAGHIKDVTHFAYIREADKGDDPADPKTHRKANPSYGITVDPDDFIAEWKAAQGSPHDINVFLRYRLGIWVQTSEPWLDMDRWVECGGEVDWSRFEGRTCCAGVDLAENRDMTALALCFPPESDTDGTSDDTDAYHYHVHCWLPAANIAERERKDGMPYRSWAEQGFLTLTDGDTTDNEAVENAIVEASERFNIEALHYDRYGAKDLMQRLQDKHGMNVVPVPQGPLSLNAPSRAFDSQVAERKMRHGDNPVLRVQASRVRTRSDANGNIMPAKTDGKRQGARRFKIDGIVACILALDGVMQTGIESTYEGGLTFV
jgi:phage terminase large subunit-like protein